MHQRYPMLKRYKIEAFWSGNPIHFFERGEGLFCLGSVYLSSPITRMKKKGERSRKMQFLRCAGNYVVFFSALNVKLKALFTFHQNNETPMNKWTLTSNSFFNSPLPISATSLLPYLLFISSLKKIWRTFAISEPSFIWESTVTVIAPWKNQHSTFEYHPSIYTGSYFYPSNAYKSV